MYLTELEEIIAFGVSTYKNIKKTIDEERKKEAEKKENEEKIKVLIKFYRTKAALIKKFEKVKKQVKEED